MRPEPGFLSKFTSSRSAKAYSPRAHFLTRARGESPRYIPDLDSGGDIPSLASPRGSDGVAISGHTPQLAREVRPLRDQGLSGSEFPPAAFASEASHHHPPQVSWGRDLLTTQTHLSYHRGLRTRPRGL